MDDILLLSAGDPPANDNIANAVTIPSGSGTLGPYTIDDATLEAGESTWGYATGQSIWFMFYVPSTVAVTLSTYGSVAGDPASGDGDSADQPPDGFLDTMMAVYYTTTPTPPTFDASINLHSNNDDHPDTGEPHTGVGTGWSYLSMSLTGPRYYWVQVGTFDTPFTGTVFLEYTGIPSPSALPNAVAGIGAVPASTVSGAATATPVAVAGVGAVPAPTAIGTGAGVASPNVVPGIGAVPSPTVTGGTGGTASPARVAGIGSVPSPTVIGGHTATASPATVAATSRVPHPRGFGAGTGGGGGTTNGVYDFWAVKALG